MSDERSKRPFSSVLQEIRGGRLHDEMTDAVAEIGDACKQLNKPGMLTLILKFQPKGEGMILVVDDLRKKKPEMDRRPTAFFSTPEGLHREDPKQGAFDFEGPAKREAVQNVQ